MTYQFIIANNSIYINSSHAPEFNVSAKLEFYNLTLQYPIAYRDGTICVSAYCSNETYNSSSGKFYFLVSGFSNYSIEEAICGDDYCNGDETCSSCSADCGSCPSSGSHSSGGDDGSSYYPITNNTFNQTNTTNVTAANYEYIPIPDNQDLNNLPADNGIPDDSEISTDAAKEPSVQNPTTISQINIKYIPWIIATIIVVLLVAYITMVSQLKNKEKKKTIQESTKINEIILKAEQYYNKMIQNGKTDTQIVNELKKVGWTDKQIEYVFSKIKKND